MTIDDFLGFEKTQYNYQVLATDISKEVLQKARTGIYSSEQIEELPKHWIKKYFNKIEGNKFQVKKEIRDLVVFREFNLKTKVFPFKRKFHTIFCRNVMIYFDAEMKRGLINNYYKLL